MTENRGLKDFGGGSVIQIETLTEAANRLSATFHPQRIILFGSQARGTADSHSDADILVICPVEGNRRKMMTEMDRALHGLCLARDIMVLTPEEYERDKWIPGTLARYASLEGKVLYERG